ncbi:MAG: type II secretion system protein [Gammaproteobacteria bacterium]|nr:type II secretion system protein [Gammaproteobacteria bacterium]
MNREFQFVQRGFTLVELLIVVIILALLAAIVVPQFAASTDDAKEAALDTTLSNVRSAIDLYYQQHGHYPSAVTSGDGTQACDGTAASNAADGEAAFLDQMAFYTNAAGEACSTKSGGGDADAYPYGPYLKKRELGPNPITNVSTLLIATAGDLNLDGTAVDLGWRFDNLSGKFIANDTSNDPSGNPYDDR